MGPVTGRRGADLWSAAVNRPKQRLSKHSSLLNRDDDRGVTLPGAGRLRRVRRQ